MGAASGGVVKCISGVISLEGGREGEGEGEGG